ncbi:hypothetical protein L873DRAFT_1804745 [Choiromyces venosus 120613-1]|uniref:Uncharacterized protein n=1 Tax=Choiromyces venosus 120613-1 TaxID=1336337 RepID=A0A3N4JTY0_9PEZI|nr:hypothetical protein L873DRAFT_1804745 [Choiromyces venosus 120613-1]
MGGTVRSLEVILWANLNFGRIVCLDCSLYCTVPELVFGWCDSAAQIGKTVLECCRAMEPHLAEEGKAGKLKAPVFDHRWGWG